MERVAVRLASFASNTQSTSNVPARWPKPQELRQAFRTESLAGFHYSKEEMAEEILNLASEAEGLFFYINSRKYRVSDPSVFKLKEWMWLYWLSTCLLRPLELAGNSLHSRQTKLWFKPECAPTDTIRIGWLLDRRRYDNRTVLSVGRHWSNHIHSQNRCWSQNHVFPGNDYPFSIWIISRCLRVLV